MSTLNMRCFNVCKMELLAILFLLFFVFHSIFQFCKAFQLSLSGILRIINGTYKLVQMSNRQVNMSKNYRVHKVSRSIL